LNIHLISLYVEKKPYLLYDENSGNFKKIYHKFYDKKGCKMSKIEVVAMEYEALKNLDQMVRLAMVNAAAAEFVAGAIQALDAVRRENGLECPASPVVTYGSSDRNDVGISDLAGNILKRVMEK
jgi:hypothetical protein